MTELKKITYDSISNAVNETIGNNKNVTILARPDSESLTIIPKGQEHYTLYVKIQEGPRVEIWLRNTMTSTQYITIWRKYVTIETDLKILSKNVSILLKILCSNDDVITKRSIKDVK